MFRCSSAASPVPPLRGQAGSTRRSARSWICQPGSAGGALRGWATGLTLALDGSRLNCNSSGILDAIVGCRKNGLYGSQINFSLLVDAATGSPVGYRYFAGSSSDVSTLEDFTSIWNACGLPDKNPMIVVDRGYYSQEGLIKLGNQGYRFLAEAKTGCKLVKSINRGPELRVLPGVVTSRKC